MESSDSMPPEMEPSPGEDIILIETVKRIVTREGHNESEGAEEDFFLISQDQTVQYPEPEGPNVEVSNRHQTDALAWMRLCRICANSSDHMIPIYEGVGVQHDLSSKILKYLPIHVSESDTLPLQLCNRCANVLMAWHELSEGCLSAERKLLELQDAQLQDVQDKQQYYNPTSLDNLELTTPILTTASTTPNVINSSLDQQDDEKNGVCDTEKNSCDTDKSNRSCGVRTPFKVSPDTPKAFWKPNRKPRVRNLTKLSAPAEDSNSVWIAVVATAHDQSSTVSEQLDSKDELPVEMKGEATTLCSVKNSKVNNESRTISVAHEEKKSERDQISDDDSMHLTLNDEKDNKDLHEILGKTLLRQETYQCSECSKCFKLKDSYLRHMRIHKNERPFTCHVCGKQFRDSGGLTRHLKDVHAKLKNFTCDLCSRSFASKATRDDHRRTHTGERPYICHSCGKTFKSKASLYIHSKLHTNEFPHTCSYCGKQFRRRQEVLAHVTTHTGEKNHCCDVCERKFRVKSELARHKLIHSENKPFVCGKCGLAFRQKRYLNNHIKSRHNESLRAS
ncbi:endothelial zinc finger protein induced by tumor necrosis factor alpha isoform X5 [Monomorium pharaonis]|uniref:endothelial zinc finger protein induced by tumor necrosis factor alpha isoform X5 n=1 Tax=Monomorium pharaonis TaxID=307658 RepID=UPI00174795F2|nr:endothelial zinc finger protein induced by tumor necrosis factor alpha isoform X5 [Monomorium pharaonis]XP_012528370.2 endothelial zinc finger protein induced by tumor necrosis factor alpha isoform X5 [Monomorium pharaonis]